MRKLVLLSVVAGSLIAVPGAQAAIPDVFGGAVTCSVAGDGVRECGTVSSDAGAGVRSTAPSWDGTPIDVKVAFPPVPSGTDGNYPLIIAGHGYGGSKNDISFSSMRRFTDRGYAVFAMTARGFHQSCGMQNAVTAAAGACDDAGWIHLMDHRYEIRDAQFLVGQLADEDVIDGQRIGAIGSSYGGGLSLQLASLKDRVMLPDGQLVPWTSPSEGKPMRIAAATPDIPWSDLAYSLTPNGAKLDYVADAAYTGRIGVQKESFVTGLFLSGQLAGGYCGENPYPGPCSDPQSDITAWKDRLDQGEPYDGDPMTTSVFDEIRAHHSAYYIDHSVPPAPLLISNGFTDDLFPADEAIAYYNRIKSLDPNAPLAMLFGDFGHMRAENKPGDSDARDAAQDAWLDFYVKGQGPQPFQGATTFALTCPDSAPSGGPFQAGSWAGLQRGVVRLLDSGAKTISAGGGSASVDTTFDPIAGDGACATASADDLPGVATYRVPAASGNGYTLMGSPTIVATIASPVANSALAARLLDVAPDGRETLVARQLFRPLVGTARQVFQLHPSGHLFAPGHVAKLELLPRDAGGQALNSYGRPANDQGDITVAKLDLRLPVLEGPGAAGGQVAAAPALPLPCGAEIAPQYSSSEYLRASLGDGKVKVTGKGRKARVPVDSAPGSNPCRVKVVLLKARVGKKKKGRAAKKGKKRSRVLARSKATTIAGGQSKTVKVKATKKSRAALRRARRIRVKVTTIDSAGNTIQLTKVKVGHGKKNKR
jgi:dienelactone hydrolase